MTRRCLLCKAFIRRQHATSCRRCGAANYDTSLSACAGLTLGPVTYMSTTIPGRFAYKITAP